MRRLGWLLAAALLGIPTGMAACSAVSGLDELSFTAGTCKTATECPKSTNECEVAACVDGMCATKLLDGVDAEAQTSGDCRIVRCRGGEAVVENDDHDLPLTKTDCDDELCTNGQPSIVMRAAREPCSTSSGVLCNGQGTCVECLQDQDCLPSSNPCSQAVCESDGRCALHPKPANTLLAAQLPGDCQIVICDGAGTQISIADENDLADDANDCTDDACVNGAPTHTARPAGTSCGNGLACDAEGQCAGCTNNAQCYTPQTCGGGGKDGVCGCTKTGCEGKTCGVWPDGCGGYVSCNNGLIDGDEHGIDCGVSNCGSCGAGATCENGQQCLSGFCVDGVCCNEACEGTCRACSSARKGIGDDGICGPIRAGLDPEDECKEEAGCGNSGVCDGAGKCANHDNGTVCGPAACQPSAGGGFEYISQGHCIYGSCQFSEPLLCPGVCSEQGCLSCTSDAQCPQGAFCEANVCKPKAPKGVVCTKGAGCESGFCVDGVCCNEACDGDCETCKNLADDNGTCLPVAEGQPDADTCAANEVCSADGACKLAHGQPCSDGSACVAGFCVDGVCCAEACSGTCEACNVAGNVGACTKVGVGKADPGTCPAPNECNGLGACKKPNGVACSDGASCTSGICADGFCCDSECGETCRACNLPGALGYCVLVPSGLPDETCGAAELCDSLGQCKNVDGQACASNADCLNDNCIDGACCTSFCTGTCMTCEGSGVCHFVGFGSSDPDTCGVGLVCNGAGTCGKGNGSACGAANECLSGHCVDGVCCNTTCDGTCRACGTGTCSLVKNASDPDTCAAPKVCDGNAACKNPNGAPCLAAAECSSGNCVDGVCCNSTCSGACKACNLAPNVGQCSNLLAGTIDTCPQPTSCNGYGACWQKNGSACGADYECLSGFCADDVCCDSACEGDCVKCNAAGAAGTCTPEPAFAEIGACTNGNACDGAGDCKKKSGSVCGGGAECLSGACVDGYCCDTSCTTICAACNLPPNVGACSYIPRNGVDPGQCDTTQACDGSGACKQALGQPCVQNEDCASGFCHETADPGKRRCESS